VDATIIGPRSRGHLDEALLALSVPISPEDAAGLAGLFV
jgi:hypothetical protein